MTTGRINQVCKQTKAKAKSTSYSEPQHPSDSKRLQAGGEPRGHVEWYIKHALHPSPHLQPHTQNSCYPSQARQRPWLSAEHGFTTTISPRVIHHFTTKTLRFSQAYDLDSDALQPSPTPLGSARWRKASSSSAETSNAISLTHFSHHQQPRLPQQFSHC